MLLDDASTPGGRFLQIHLGGDRNFCYLIGDPESGAAAAVDPAFAPERMAAIAAEQGLRIELILVTHGHADHASGTEALRRLTGASVHAGRDDRVPGADPLSDGDRLRLGEHEVLALHTPGHTPGHICYHYAGSLLTGDILFCGKVGGTGTHFPGSSAEAEWRSLRRLLELPDETRVLPGHDFYGGPGAMPRSTIGHERRHNPFLLCPDLAAFVALKDGWADYKRAHGIR